MPILPNERLSNALCSNIKRQAFKHMNMSSIHIIYDIQLKMIMTRLENVWKNFNTSLIIYIKLWRSCVIWIIDELLKNSNMLVFKLSKILHFDLQ